MVNMRCQRILVICPKRVITSWRDQFGMHAGDAIVAVPLAKGTVAKRTALAADALKMYEPCAIITNYESLIQPAMKEWAMKQSWDIIVADEVHRIKAPGGKISKTVATLGKRARYRLGLSGTPFPHSPLDGYAPMRFLAPDIFGTNFNHFKNTYAVTNPSFHDEVVEWKNLDDLNAKFYSIADRVMTRDVIDLPDERDEQVVGELSEKARKHYDEIATLFWTELENLPDEPSEVSITNVLTRILRLQQITSGYVRDDDGVDRVLDTTKADLLAELLADLPVDEPVVLFAKFKHDLDTIRRVVAAAHRTYGEISGRHDDYERWQSGDIHTIGVQLQAGGEGLNDLVRARYGIYYSIDHSLKNFNQSRARLVRPGQNHPVIFYHLLCKDTIDFSIYQALAGRQELVTALLKERKREPRLQSQDGNDRGDPARLGVEMRHF
jgi:SNF2 family DNA or RNA helicase